MVGLLHHWHAIITNSFDSVRSLLFRCRSICNSLLAWPDHKHKWKLLFINTGWTSEGYDEKASDYTIVDLHPVDHIDDRDCSCNPNTRSCAPLSYHTGICLLLVYHQLHTIWPKDSKETMSMSLGVIVSWSMYGIYIKINGWLIVKQYQLSLPWQFLDPHLHSIWFPDSILNW